jgi:hypothetical protein
MYRSSGSQRSWLTRWLLLRWRGIFECCFSLKFGRLRRTEFPPGPRTRLRAEMSSSHIQ